MKVWTMKYVGSDNRAPSILNVPSSNQTGRPSGNEIYEALKSMGYSSAEASAISNGGSERNWKVL